MALSFGKHPDVVFARAPLYSVLCQVRFEPILSLLSEVGIAGFAEGVRSRFPHYKAHFNTLIGVTPNGQGQSLSQTPPVWKFYDSEDQWRWCASVGPDFVALQTSRYHDFEEFLQQFTFVLDIFDLTVHPNDAKRIGLRKINILGHPDVATPRDWKAHLRDELLSLVGIEMPGQVALSLSDIRLLDGVNELAIRHGVMPQRVLDDIMRSVDPTDARIPSPEMLPESAKKEEADDGRPLLYMLDLDYSTPVPYSIRGDEALAELLTEFSDGITSFFHLSLIHI